MYVPVNVMYFVQSINFYRWLYILFVCVLVISNVSIETSVLLGLLAILCVVCV